MAVACFHMTAHACSLLSCDYTQCRREGGGGGGGKGVHYPGPRGTKGAPRSLRIIFFQLCATTLSAFRLQSSTESFFFERSGQHTPPPPPPPHSLNRPKMDSTPPPPLVKSAESGTGSGGPPWASFPGLQPGSQRA